MTTITQVQQLQQQTRVRASEIERVMREKEQIQQELQTANTRRDGSQQQIRQLQQQVSDIIVTSLYKSCEYFFIPSAVSHDDQ